MEKWKSNKEIFAINSFSFSQFSNELYLLIHTNLSKRTVYDLDLMVRQCQDQNALDIPSKILQKKFSIHRFPNIYFLLYVYHTFFGRRELFVLSANAKVSFIDKFVEDFLQNEEVWLAQLFQVQSKGVA